MTSPATPAAPPLSYATRYRPPGGFRKSLASLFRLHNETGACQLEQALAGG